MPEQVLPQYARFKEALAHQVGAARRLKLVEARKKKKAQLQAMVDEAIAGMPRHRDSSTGVASDAVPLRPSHGGNEEAQGQVEMQGQRQRQRQALTHDEMMAKARGTQVTKALSNRLRKGRAIAQKAAHATVLRAPRTLQRCVPAFQPAGI